MSLKLSKNHEIYEVWNEWAAASVFIDHRPTWDELVEIFNKNQWKTTPINNCDTTEKFIKRYVHVERLNRFYVSGN